MYINVSKCFMVYCEIANNRENSWKGSINAAQYNHNEINFRVKITF